MATLIGTVPPGLTFEDLVGVSAARGVAGSQPPRKQGGGAMRIYLPEGAERVMALTRHQEFLISYSIQDTRPGSKPVAARPLASAL